MASRESKKDVRDVDVRALMDEARRRREAKAVQLRKDKREMGIDKKRRGPPPGMEALAAAAAPAPAAAVTTPATLPADLNIIHLDLYCDAARSGEIPRQLEGVTAIRRLLSKESRPPVEQVLATGILPRLIELLAAPDAKLAFEAAWAVTNIASTEFTATVVDAGAVPRLVQGMMHADANVRDQCVWCIGNIAGDCARYRDALISTPGALQALMINLQHPANEALLRNATWTLSNFCRGKPVPPMEAVKGMLPALAYLLNSRDTDVLQDALWGISYLSDSDEAAIQAVVDAGVARRCVQLMSHEEVRVVTPALRVVGNLIAGNDKQTQAAVEAGALSALAPLLEHPKKTIRREAAWAVSNVAAGTKEQITQLMAVPGLMASIVGLLRAHEFAVRKEAAWVVANVATMGTAEQVRTLIALQVATPLVEVLSAEDARLQCVVLDAVQAILKAGAKMPGAPFADVFEEAGLLEQLDYLQEYGHSDVHDKAAAIVDDFYGREEDGAADEADEAPASLAIMPAGGSAGAAPAATFSFGAPMPLGASMAGNSFAFGAPAAGAKLVPAAAPVAAPAMAGGFNFSGFKFA